MLLEAASGKKGFHDLLPKIVATIAPHNFERRDIFFDPIKMCFHQGGCTVDYILNAGIDEKVKEGSVSAFPHCGLLGC